MKLLIVYGTTEGHTRKICRFLAEGAQEMGLDVKLCDSTDSPCDPLDADGVIVAASIHMHKYQSSIMHYCKRFAEELNARPSAFVSVSMTAASEDAEELVEMHKITQHFLDFVEWKPRMVEQVAGALLYTEYDFFKRFMMKAIARQHHAETDTSKDHDYTDYQALEQFLMKFVEDLKGKKQQA